VSFDDNPSASVTFNSKTYCPATKLPSLNIGVVELDRVIGEGPEIFVQRYELILSSASEEWLPFNCITFEGEQDVCATFTSWPALATGGWWLSLVAAGSFLQETKIIISIKKAQAANFSIDFMIVNFKSNDSTWPEILFFFFLFVVEFLSKQTVKENFVIEFSIYFLSKKYRRQVFINFMIIKFKVADSSKPVTFEIIFSGFSCIYF